MSISRIPGLLLLICGLFACAQSPTHKEPATTPDASSLLDSSAEQPPPSPLRVKIMTFNIRQGIANDGENGWNYRKPMVFDIIKREGGDFVGMQEAWKFQLDDIVAAAPDYKCIGRSRKTNTEFDEWSPICYRHARWEVDAKEQGTFWLSLTPDKEGSQSWESSLPRIATWGRFVEKGTNQALYVFNTHYDHKSQQARLESSKLLAKKIHERAHPDEPVLLMGDFNAEESNPSITYLKGEGPATERSPVPLADTFRLLHPDQKEAGTFNSWKGTTTGDKIDYIFVQKNPDIKVHSAQILHDNKQGRYPSDHYPVTADIEFPK